MQHNPIPEKVFCDFTCILHSPLKINALGCVGKVCKKTTYTLYLVSVSAILSPIKNKADLIIQPCFHLSGNKSLYLSNGVLGCHSAVLSIMSVRYSNKSTLFILHDKAKV